MTRAFKPDALVGALFETEPETASRRGDAKVVRAPGRAVERDHPARTGLRPMVLPVHSAAGAGRLA